MELRFCQLFCLLPLLFSSRITSGAVFKMTQIGVVNLSEAGPDRIGNDEEIVDITVNYTSEHKVIAYVATHSKVRKIQISNGEATTTTVISVDADIQEGESIERIYYDERPSAHNVIILTRSASGESGHLANYSVDNSPSKEQFDEMIPVCQHNISFIHRNSNSPLLTCTSNESIYRFVPEKEEINNSKFSGIQVSSLPFLPNTDDWVWIGGKRKQYGFMGITFVSAENKSLTAWSSHEDRLNNYCKLYNGTNPSTLAFLKGDETFLLALGLDSNTGNLNALICDITSNSTPTMAKSWVNTEVNNSLVNFTSTAVLKAAASSVSVNANHPLFVVVQSPGSSLLVWYDIQMQDTPSAAVTATPTPTATTTPIPTATTTPTPAATTTPTTTISTSQSPTTINANTVSTTTKSSPVPFTAVASTDPTTTVASTEQTTAFSITEPITYATSTITMSTQLTTSGSTTSLYTAASQNKRQHYRFRPSNLATGAQLKFKKVYATSAESCSYFCVRRGQVSAQHFCFVASQMSCYLPDANGNSIDYPADIGNLECYTLDSSA